MGWRFWQHGSETAAQEPGIKTKLPKPKELPQQVGQYLVIHEKRDPDWVWALRCVVRPHAQRKTTFDFMVFSSSAAQDAGVVVSDYDALARHLELVLYQGWYDKRTNQIEIQKNSRLAA